MAFPLFVLEGFSEVEESVSCRYREKEHPEQYPVHVECNVGWTKRLLKSRVARRRRKSRTGGVEPACQFI
jgi:hypothetical protein